MSNIDINDIIEFVGGEGGRGGRGEGRGMGEQTERNNGGDVAPAAPQAPDYSAQTVDALAQAQTISADEIALYDRQIRLWGVKAQEKLRTAHVLLITIKALANEIAKNLVLAGIGAITLVDPDPVTEEDLGAQFLVSEEDVGKNRARAASSRLQKLNPRVTVHVDESDIRSRLTAAGPGTGGGGGGGSDGDFFATFSMVIATGLDFPALRAINARTRAAHVPFYAADMHGFYGYVFADLLAHEFIIERDRPNVPSAPGQRESATRTVVAVAARREPGTGRVTEVVTKRELYCPIGELLGGDGNTTHNRNNGAGVASASASSIAAAAAASNGNGVAGTNGSAASVGVGGDAEVGGAAGTADAALNGDNDPNTAAALAAAAGGAPLPADLRRNPRRRRQVPPLLAAFKALWAYEQKWYAGDGVGATNAGTGAGAGTDTDTDTDTGALPPPPPSSPMLLSLLRRAHGAALAEFVRLATAAQRGAALQLPLDALAAPFLRGFLGALGRELAPAAAFLGGLLAQEAINALGAREQPVQNVLLFDGLAASAPVYCLSPLNRDE